MRRPARRGPAELITYAEAFERYVGLDPHTASIEALIAAARECGSPPESLASDDRDGWLDWLLTERVQARTRASSGRCCFTTFPPARRRWPQVRPGPPPVAERFELYVAGWELANGYHGIARSARIAAAKRGGKRPAPSPTAKSALPEESRLLAAMEHGLPPAVGCALGFDRLVMLAAGAKSIEEVIAFPWDRA